jgi:hypothetical protein
MANTMAWVLGALSLGAMIDSTSVQAADDPFSTSSISLSGGVSSITERFDGFNGYFNSHTATGGSLGAAVRLNPIPGLLIDLDYGRDQATINDLDVTRQQGEVGIGYLGPIWRYSSWYVEAVYAHVEFENSSPSLCGGTCLTEQHDGVGAKGGIIWPFGDQWYSTLSAGYISMAAHDGFDGLGESLVNASIGYMINPSFSVGVRAEYLAYSDRNDNSAEQDFASWRAFVSYHF